PTMYRDEATQEALAKLRRRAFEIVEPVEGDVACGENGQGKLASIERIADSVVRLLDRSDRLKGWRVLLTSGPTQEPIDQAR
ncbi:phosphopantothenoylcysteine decarboxylase, partial [Acinetobacter baumannii]